MHLIKSHVAEDLPWCNSGKKTGTAPAKEEKPTTVEKSIGGAKNGEKRTISTDKAQKYYPVSAIYQRIDD
jgi:hypothetical protein